MTTPLHLRFSAEFVLGRATPTASEIAYGLRTGLLTAAGAVAIAEEKVRAGTEVSAAELELAALLPSELDEAIALTPRLAPATTDDDPARLWMYLCVDAVRDRPDAVTAVALIFEWFGHPDELAPLVYWMPANVSTERPSVEGLWAALEAYLIEQQAAFRARTPRPR